jgi:hypothetical protein
MTCPAARNVPLPKGPSAMLLPRLSARLIADWKKAHRYWSVRLSGLATLLTATWAALPADLRDHFPHAQWLAVSMFALIGLSRILAQAPRP